jgi:hypothetical protein
MMMMGLAAEVRARTMVLVVRVPVMRLGVVRRRRRRRAAVAVVAELVRWTVRVMVAVRTVSMRRGRRREGVPVSRRRGRAMTAVMTMRSVGSLRMVRAMMAGITGMTGMVRVMTVEGTVDLTAEGAIDRVVIGGDARRVVVGVFRLKDGAEVEMGGLLLHLVDRVLGGRVAGDVR